MNNNISAIFFLFILICCAVPDNIAERESYSNYDHQTFSNTTSASIPDNDLTGIISSINVTSIFDDVSRITLKLNITHAMDSDLDIYLESPYGTRIEISTDNGATGNDYDDTFFSDSASTDITAGTAPFSGSYRPEEELSVFKGEASNGSWKLNIVDDGPGDIGTFKSWELTIYY